MIFQKIFTPALLFMDRLSFKFKIIASISILFILLIFPSRTIFQEHYEQKERQNLQLIGLEYITFMYKLMGIVQNHRELTMIYIEDTHNTSIIEDLEVSENRFYGLRSSLSDYDSKNLQLLEKNPNFIKAITKFELVTTSRMKKNLTQILDKEALVEEMYKKHNEIVKLIRKATFDISQKTYFSESQDSRINYLGEMLQDKLPQLYDYTGRLKGISSTILLQKKMLHEQTKNLYAISSSLTSLESQLVDNIVLSRISNYEGLQGYALKVSDTLEEILLIINQDILQKYELDQSIPIINQRAKVALTMQEALFESFIYSYRDSITELNAQLDHDLSILLAGFIAIILIASYIVFAFYLSITGNLKKLQTASEMIAEGKTDIHLEVDKKDEIGDALLAFNTMSDKLNTNISFLDGYKLAIDKSSIVSKTDLKGIITYANDMFCEVSGYTREELIGSSHNIVRHPDVPKEEFKNMWDTIQDKRIWKGVVKNRRKDGSAYIVNATILPILDNKGEISEYVAVRHDITELEASKEEIKKQRVDLLTSLPNRNQLLEDLETAIKPIIFYINIDDFSGLNDFYGERVGDNILLRLTEILSQMQSDKTFALYKLESDQFLLLFEEGYLSRDNLELYFEEMIQEIEKQVIAPEGKYQNRIAISVSGGAVTYYANDDYEKLILYSNIARKKAREEHKKFLLFKHSMRKHEDYAHNTEWVKRIKEAINEDRIVCYYQPIYREKNTQAFKFETLVRLLDKDGQAVSPFFFLEIAKKARLYPQITQIIIDKAFEKFENLPEYAFSINLTIDDILSDTTKNYIYQKLESFPHPERVIFEITESQEVDDYKIINNFIKYVKEYNVQIAVDDFGSGYANFEHILNIDADFIKVDGSLIKNVHTDPNSRIITEAIISFSKKLKRETIVEFVHNEEVYTIVKSLGADYCQGFYLGAPSSTIN